MTLPTFGKRQPPPPPPPRGQNTINRPAPVAVFGEGVTRPPSQGRQITYENTRAEPPITVKGTTGAPPTWSTNAYYRNDVQLEEAQLTPVERGHIYTAVAAPSVGMWDVTALRLLDEEGACLLDGLHAESKDPAVRTRFVAKLRDPQYMSEGFYLSDNDLLTFRRRVLDIGGHFSAVGPIKGEAAEGALLVRQQMQSGVDNCVSAVPELLELVAQITDANWMDISKQLKDRMARLEAEYATASEAVTVWRARLKSSMGSADDPDIRMAHHRIEAAVRCENQAESAQGILRPVRSAFDDAIRRVADGLPPAPFNVDAALAALEDRVWWLRKLRLQLSMPERAGLTDSIGVTAEVGELAVTVVLRKTGASEASLPRAVIDRLVEAEIERRRAAERAVAPAAAVGGRFDLE